MNTQILRIVGVATTLVLMTAPAQALQPHVRIDRVEGAKSVILQRGISLREAVAGEEVEIGERIRTDRHTTVTLAYPDGSKLVIYPNTDLEIEKPHGRVQSSELRVGMVQGSIEKSSEKNAYGSQGGSPALSVAKPIKFVIRTKTATMGVRGTEFVAGFDAVQALAQFNTLEGTVEVATTPAQLMSGVGVPVSSGQMVQATAETGLGSVQGFNRANFLNDLGSSVGGAETHASVSSASGAASLFRDSTQSTNSSEVASGNEVRRAPPAPAPHPQEPVAPPAPPLTPAAAEEKLKAQEGERPRMHLFNFALGGFLADNPNSSHPGRPRSYRAFEVNWTPSIPLPALSFLYLRGAFGVTLFENYSLNNSFLIQEYQLLAGTTLLSPLFAEFGAGHQSWRSEQSDGLVLSANAGLILSPNGKFNRVYGGVSKYFENGGSFELRAGIGVQLF